MVKHFFTAIKEQLKVEVRVRKKLFLSMQDILLVLKIVLASDHFGVPFEDIKMDTNLLHDTNLSSMEGSLGIQDFIYHLELIFFEGRETFDDISKIKEGLTVGMFVNFLFWRRLSKLRLGRLPVSRERGVLKIPESLMKFAA